MLCRSRVVDFPAWKAVFDSHASDVFFVFEVGDVERATG